MDKGGNQAPPQDSLLVVMAKTPRAGEVKTRLIPPLTPEDAAAFHRACLIDTLEKVKSLSGVVPALAYTPDDTEAEFLELWPGELLRFPQSGRSLGERMLNCLRRGFAEGFRFVAVHGTDIPHAPAQELLRGFEELRTDRADLVLGPTLDGGYYYLAVSADHTELFRDIRWGTREVYEKTLKRADNIGLRIGVIAPVRDLDTPEDLDSVHMELIRSGPSDPDWRSASRTRWFLKEQWSA